MTAKSYAITSLKTFPPIEFALEGDGYAETFRVPRKQREDIVRMLTTAMYLDADGNRVYPAGVIRSGMILIMAKELWDPTARAETQTADEEPMGDWVACDDQIRFVELLDSPRYEIESQRLGEILWDVLEEVTGHPIGAPRP